MSDRTFDTVLELRVKAEDWQAYHRAKELALAAQKSADAAWALLGFPAKGDGWAKLAKVTDGQSAQVVVRDGNGTPLASGVVSQRTNPPREASTFWVSPRL